MMKTSYSVAFFVTFIIILYSCDNSPRLIQEVKDLNGRVIEFPKYEILAYDSILIQKNNCNSNDIKLVSYLDNVPCSPCIFNMLQNRVQEVKKELGDDFSYIIVLQVDDRQKLLNAIRKFRFQTPIIYYGDNRFSDINDLHILARNKTFLLNNDNKIMVMGEPFGNKKLWKVYKTAINQLKNEKASNR